MLTLLAMSAGSITAIIIAVVVVLVLLAVILGVLPIRIWFRALVSGVKVSMARLIGMKWRGVKVATIVDAYISAMKAGLDVTIDELETHVLAKGDAIKVVNALISAHSANIQLAPETARAIDLAGRDVLNAVKVSVNPKVIETPGISAIAKDGIELRVKARVTVRANITRLIGGAGEDTIIARIGEGIVTTVGSADSHKDVLENPDQISKTVLNKGLDNGTAFEILSIDIADIDVGRTPQNPGKVHLGLRNGENGVLNRLTGAEQHLFEGPHPAGNVGVQIHHIDPINKGDIVWTVDIQNVALIGRLFNTGTVDMRRTIAVTGSETCKPQYVSVLPGTLVGHVTAACGIREEDNVRIIAGNVLTGQKVDVAAYIDMYHNQMTMIPEGYKYELLGWIAPRLHRFSVSHSYFSWLMPKKKYDLDTNLNGGRRALVVTGLYDRYLPMDIYPIYLLKACMAGDIEKMEDLGIYEVLPEDFALCEFVDPSKTDMQAIIADGINLMIKELC